MDHRDNPYRDLNRLGVRAGIIPVTETPYFFIITREVDLEETCGPRLAAYVLALERLVAPMSMREFEWF